jgi:hypothetical protein
MPVPSGKEGCASSPLDIPWRLAASWSGAELVVVDEGHGGGPEMTAAIVLATDRFAGSAGGG